jgi:hypothetical protein
MRLRVMKDYDTAEEQHNTTQHCTQHSIVHNSTAQQGTIQNSKALYSTVAAQLHPTLLRPAVLTSRMKGS